MCECGMSDGFEPVSVLKGYVKDSRDAAERVCKEDKEVNALKAVIKIIKDRNLEAEFSEERVEEPRGGILGPYMSPVAAGLYGSAAIPQPVYYGQQAGFVMPPFHPSYYSQ
ncbi:hypothetical protein F2Q70_00006034 [Brassica cretica]|uniref:FRIGIDA-like protein n=1 Tax=Brassica cretica TaxID=69181 RepID=A0A8S9IS05_BRACR|nr:hypothetical protein F2Q70_00006034 [Brassica cretica]